MASAAKSTQRDPQTGLTKREMGHMRAIVNAVKEFVHGELAPLRLRNHQLTAEIEDLKAELARLRDAAR